MAFACNNVDFSVVIEEIVQWISQLYDICIYTEILELKVEINFMND